VLRRAGGPLAIGQVAERVVALRALDAASVAVRTAMERTVGRAVRHHRTLGAVRPAGKDGRRVLWETAGG
jgi:hypothetical protein